MKMFPFLSYSLWRPLFSLPKSLRSPLNAASNPSMLRCPGTPSGGCQSLYLEHLCRSRLRKSESLCGHASGITMQTASLYWVYWVSGCLGKLYVIITLPLYTDLGTEFNSCINSHMIVTGTEDMRLCVITRYDITATHASTVNTCYSKS